MNNRILLLILTDEEDMKCFQEKLTDNYTLLRAKSIEEGQALLQTCKDQMDAILIGLDVASKDYKAVSDLIPPSGQPLIGVAKGALNADDMLCLSYGFKDILNPLNPKELLINRIQNAINADISFTVHEIEKMLRALPCIVYFKDAQGRYVFSTQKWLPPGHTDDPNWTIRGKTDVEIREDKENAQKAMESDQKIITSGEGMDYVIKEKAFGQDSYFELIKRPVFDGDEIMGIIALVTDVTERELLRQKLEIRSRTDALTEMLNKQTAEERMKQVIEDAKLSGERCALLMIDADEFKGINDTFGHTAGDRVLSAIGQAIRSSSRESDVAGRVGGDEFALLLRNIPSIEVACNTAKRIRVKAEEAIPAEKLGKNISLSIGIAGFPDNGSSFEELFKAADAALYFVKNHGKGAYHVYEPSDSL